MRSRNNLTRSPWAVFFVGIPRWVLRICPLQLSTYESQEVLLCFWPPIYATKSQGVDMSPWAPWDAPSPLVQIVGSTALSSCRIFFSKQCGAWFILNPGPFNTMHFHGIWLLCLPPQALVGQSAENSQAGTGFADHALGWQNCNLENW